MFNQAAWQIRWRLGSWKKKELLYAVKIQWTHESDIRPLWKGKSNTTIRLYNDRQCRSFLKAQRCSLSKHWTQVFGGRENQSDDIFCECRENGRKLSKRWSRQSPSVKNNTDLHSIMENPGKEILDGKNIEKQTQDMRWKRSNIRK